MRVRLGVDVLAAHPERCAYRSIGVLTNDAARSGDDPIQLSRTQLKAAGIALTRVFSPEHGLQAIAADGAAVSDGIDAATGLPVISLYGPRLAPSDEDLDGLDGVLIDLPDVGARFYTYAWTMTHMLDACARADIPVLVLDRPNPTGGRLSDAEGPMLEASCQSLLGRDAMPVRHTLTIGELARRWQREHVPHLELDVVRCEGWRRDMHWPDTGLPFVALSPAMPTYETTVPYPGTCLFESTNVGVGRESERPFRRLQAPWFDAKRVVHEISMDPWCHGLVARAAGSTSVDLDVADPRTFRPVRTGIALLSLVRRLHPDDFRWTDYPTAANPTGAGHLERLLGRTGVRFVIESATDAPGDWFDAKEWRERVEPVLLYD